MHRAYATIVLLFCGSLSSSTTALAVDRTYYNSTEDDIIIWMRPVRGTWKSSGALEPGKHWAVQLGGVGSSYEFKIGFPESREYKSIGIKSVQNPNPAAFDIISRTRIRSEYKNGSMSAPLEIYYDLQPRKK